MLELLANPQTWIALATLTALELVLGIDNIIFISILVDKLPRARQELARRVGLFAAMFMRIGLHLCRQALRRAVQRRGERLTIGGVNRHELFLGPTAGLHSLQILSIKHDLLEWIVRARLRHRSLRFSRTVCRPPRGHLYLPPE